MLVGNARCKPTRQTVMQLMPLSEIPEPATTHTPDACLVCGLRSTAFLSTCSPLHDSLSRGRRLGNQSRYDQTNDVQDISCDWRTLYQSMQPRRACICICICSCSCSCSYGRAENLPHSTWSWQGLLSSSDTRTRKCVVLAIFLPASTVHPSCDSFYRQSMCFYPSNAEGMGSSLPCLPFCTPEAPVSMADSIHLNTSAKEV